MSYISPLLDVSEFEKKAWLPVGILKVPSRKGNYIIDCYLYKFTSYSLIDRLALSLYINKDLILEEKEYIKTKKLADLDVCDYEEFKDYINRIYSIAPKNKEISAWKKLDLLKWSTIRIVPSKKIIEDIERNVKEIVEEEMSSKIKYREFIEELHLNDVLEYECEWKKAYVLVCMDKKNKIYYIINGKKYRRNLIEKNNSIVNFLS